MSEVSSKTFGHAIAFLIPGFVVVWALSPVSPTLASWLGSPEAAVSIGGFFYGTIASLVAGLIVSAMRATLLDFVHHKTGIPRPDLDYSKLQANKDAFNIVIEQLYRYYQFYANMFVAALVAYTGHLISGSKYPWNEVGLSIIFVALEIVLFLASRDSLSRCYLRLAQVMS